MIEVIYVEEDGTVVIKRIETELCEIEGEFEDWLKHKSEETEK